VTERGAGATPIVFVVDDDAAVREALSSLLRSAGLAVEVFASAQAFLDREESDRPSCLILDVDLPVLNGLDLQARLIAHHKRMPILFVTGKGDIPTTVRAMKAGAVEFLTKPFSEEELLQGVERALALDLASRQQAAREHELRDRYAQLKPREQEVMTRVVSGKLNKQVAADLGLSEITVKVHRRGAMEKMGAESLADLVRIAERLGLRRL
jgi:FixJ family two-component response regulator